MKKRVLVKLLAMKLDLSQAYQHPDDAVAHAERIVQFLDEIEVLDVERELEVVIEPEGA